ncbi:MAG: leucine-rich repeat protein [Ruminococcus sp.]|nr:leucine-rich repeat protein [Ruminococcus sp.]
MKLKNLIVSLAVLINALPLYSYAGNAENVINIDGMTFSFRDNFSSELIMTAYSGKSENLIVPEFVGDFTVTAIGDGVFQDNKNIKNVILPDSINYFGEEVFTNSSLVSVNIPRKLHMIPSASFSYCKSLENVIFNDNIKIISENAFEGTGIDIPPELQSEILDTDYMKNSDSGCGFDSGDWRGYIECNGDDIYAYISYCDKRNDTEITVPDNICGIPVTGINDKAFCNIKTIKKIYFPDTITKMDVDFKNSALEEITLPDVNTINKAQFYGCKNLRKVTVNGNSKYFTIGEQAFTNCTNLDSISYPETCKNLTIGKRAFENTAIKEIRLDIASDIGENAFRKCGLSYVELNDAHLNKFAFRECPFVDVTIKGNSVLEEMSFYECDNLKNITLSDYDISMKNAVFNCRALETINNINAFDDSAGDFNKDLNKFIHNNFSGSDDVGFINRYVTAKAEKTVSEIISENMSDVQKIKAVHDWICENTVYDDGLTIDRKNHNDASVFMNDSTVCEGYARIANIMYNIAGIESYYVNSTSHAWNVVRAGNNYFHVDTTWDDGETVSHEWFLKSDEELRKSGGSHAEWNLCTPSSLHNFQNNVLPECSYSLGDVNQDKNINIADMVILNNYVTGQEAIEDYDSFILADITSDGIVDSFDLVRIRQLITG